MRLWQNAFVALALSLVAGVALAAGDVGEVKKQAVNIPAIVMFLVLVGATLGITYWAAQRTKTA